jgi:hypothetical protein
MFSPPSRTCDPIYGIRMRSSRTIVHHTLVSIRRAQGADIRFVGGGTTRARSPCHWAEISEHLRRINFKLDARPELIGLQTITYEAARRSAMRSDSALIVAEGLTLNAVGIMAPSDTYSPG